MVKRSVGPRSKTRHKLSKKPRERGMPPPSHALREFPRGSRVHIVLNPAIQAGMPHHRFHGLTGTILERRGRAFVVEVVVGRKRKLLTARPEHLRANRAAPADAR